MYEKLITDPEQDRKVGGAARSDPSLPLGCRWGKITARSRLHGDRSVMAAPHLRKPCCRTSSTRRTEEDNGVNSVGDRIADLVSTKQPGPRENGLLGSGAGAGRGGGVQPAFQPRDYREGGQRRQ